MYDILFIGHICFDELSDYKGHFAVSVGSAVVCGAMAAARAGKKVAVLTRLSVADNDILNPMKDAGIDVYAIPAAETSYIKVIHPSDNVDERELILIKKAGFFSINDLPEIEAKNVHLAGISDQEFDLEFIKALSAKGVNLSADMQSFVRQANKSSGVVNFNDVVHKKEIVKLLQKVKLDIVEAKILTQSNSMTEAAKIIASWGTNEVVVTEAKGILAYSEGKTYYNLFSNNSVIGRTGRGDTTFAAYLAYRQDHNIEESVRFASALVSVKMETPGPFCGTFTQVIDRMNEKHKTVEIF